MPVAVKKEALDAALDDVESYLFLDTGVVDDHLAALENIVGLAERIHHEQLHVHVKKEVRDVVKKEAGVLIKQEMGDLLHVKQKDGRGVCMTQRKV